MHERFEHHVRRAALYGDLHLASQAFLQHRDLLLRQALPACADRVVRFRNVHHVPPLERLVAGTLPRISVGFESAREIHGRGSPLRPVRSR